MADGVTAARIKKHGDNAAVGQVVVHCAQPRVVTT